jgi:hypothetical protein
MLIYGSYWTNHTSFPISVTTGGIVNVKLAAASGAAQQVYSSTTTPVYVRSASSTTYTYVATSAARALKVYSSTTSPVYTASATSAGLHYVATPASATINVTEYLTIATSSFTSGKIVTGTASAVSTNITAGLYHLSARGNAFYCRTGGTAASLTTVTFAVAEGESKTLYLKNTKFSSITPSTAGYLTLVKVS